MKRDPKEEYIKRYMKSIKIKKNYPRLYWRKCERCGMEYVKEPMLESFSLLSPNHDIIVTHCVCTNCFKNEETFKTWLQDVGLLYRKETVASLYEARRYFH